MSVLLNHVGEGRPESPGFVQRLARIPLSVLFCLLALCPIRAAAQADVRVLIDVSGSMRETDPQNLRVPAVQLLINLLRDGTRAGFWTFGTEGAVLIPHGEINETWRARAMDRARRIDSSARYTDVADGLYLVDRDWRETTEDESRIVILLTDGQVDVDDDPRLDAQSRKEILRQRLPALQGKGVRLYAVGLSRDADLRLLEEMAIQTGGFAVVARDSDELLGAFLDIFAAAIPVNAVPVERQQFRVDATVRELTVLAMHPYRHEPVGLRLPDGSLWRGGRHGSASRWLAQDTFTLIHVLDPPQGEWALLGGGRDTRVHIHSNLRVALSGVHRHALPGELLNVTSSLASAGGEPVSPDFLALLHHRLRWVPPAGEPLQLAARALPDGRVEASVPVPVEPGLYRLEATATAGIIHRQATAMLRVYEDAYGVREEDIERASGPGKRFSLRVRQDVISPAGLQVSGILRNPAGKTLPLPVTPQADRWVVEMDVLPGVQEFRFRLAGRILNGRRFETTTPARLFGQPVQQEVAPDDADAAAPAVQPEPEVEGDPPVWAWVLGLLLGGGALAGLGGLLLLRWRASRKATDAAPAVDAEPRPAAAEDDLPAIVNITQVPGQKPGDPPAGNKT